MVYTNNILSVYGLNSNVLLPKEVKWQRKRWIYMASGGSRGGRSRRAPPVQGPKNKKTTIFRPKYSLECVI